MDKPSRPQRNRRHSRRAWPPEDDVHDARPAKRLFTPEIKRMLKDWLVRRRENPYPSRDEKKRLAYETGLTYTQICNWFANWRRKLKNSEHERVRRSWGHLIKHYNTNAKGNVEQFSISSEDSIWEEAQQLHASDGESHDEGSSSTELERNGLEQPKRNQRYELPAKPNIYVDSNQQNNNNCIVPTQHYQKLPPIDHREVVGTVHIGNGKHININTNSTENTFSAHKAKYKQKMMEKYLREEHIGAQQFIATDVPPANALTGGAELSKWLESAVKFTPDKHNYFIEWHSKRNKLETNHGFKQPQRVTFLSESLHHKDELDAAEALANLAFNCRQRMLDAKLAVRQTHISAIGS